MFLKVLNPFDDMKMAGRRYDYSGRELGRLGPTTTDARGREAGCKRLRRDVFDSFSTIFDRLLALFGCFWWFSVDVCLVFECIWRAQASGWCK